MCGIAGVFSSGSLSDTERSLFKWMLYFNKTRGNDSTGVYMHTSHRNNKIIKSLGSPEDLWNADVSRDLFSYDGDCLVRSVTGLLGHTRAANSGRVVTSNAHPFRHKNVVGVHNGKVKSEAWFPKNGISIHEVDSHRLIEALGEGHDIKDLAREIPMAYTLIWVDGDKGTLNFARNEERPLHFMISKDAGTIAFASELWQIDVARHVSRAATAFGKIEELKTHAHVEIPLAKHRMCEGIKVTAYKPYVAPASSVVPRQVTSTTTTTTTPKLDGQSLPRIMKYDMSDYEETPDGWAKPRETINNVADFRRVINSICTLCMTNMSYEDYVKGHSKLISPTCGVCPECVSIIDDEKQQLEQKETA